MRRKKDRVVIDTNLWVSFLLTKTTPRLDRLFQRKSILLLFSQELLDEFIEVAGRTKFKKYFTSDDLEDLLFQIRIYAEFITIKSTVVMCRDPKDNFLLSLAKDGKADFLLTGDNDLLALKKIGKTHIQTISQFLLEKGTIR